MSDATMKSTHDQEQIKSLNRQVSELHRKLRTAKTIAAEIVAWAEDCDEYQAAKAEELGRVLLKALS